MQLKVKRDQQQKGLLIKRMTYSLSIRVEFTEEERAVINKANLGGTLLYRSESGKTIVTPKSLKDGHFWESDDLAAIANLHEGVIDGCKKLKAHLEVSDKFKDGEGVIEI